MDSLYVVLSFIGVSLGFILSPLALWLGYDGVKIKLWRWKMKSGKYDASAFFDKNNNISLVFKKREGSRIRINNGSYVSTPSPNRLYYFLGLPVRIRRENDPEDIDIWDRETNLPLTAKEIDNTINEAESQGIIQILKQYLPIVLIVAAVVGIATLWNGYLLYQLYDFMKSFAPEMIRLFPEGFK
jgi:hypothetical protein